MEIGQQLLLQFILILINAFFAATEIAVVSLSENKLSRQAKDGDRKAEKMMKMVTEPTNFLSTIQIGITLAGFLGSAFAADNFSDYLTDWLMMVFKLSGTASHTVNTVSVILITLILSYFTLVLGELVPKRIAMKKSEQLARAVCPVINALSVILRPVNWFMSKSTNGVLRLLGVNPHDEAEAVSEDEIRMMIDIGEEKGTINSDEKEMIDNIFEFNNRCAVDIMRHRTDMAVIWEDDSAEDIIKLIYDSGFSRFPVCGGDIDEIKGILRTREYLLNLRSENPRPLAELIQPPYFVPETVRADVLFREMQEKKCHMAIVIDEYGGTSGLLTMEDLLEEIVGNIYDETDAKVEQTIIKLGENEWKIAGTVPIEEVEDALEVKISEDDDDYGTLGGLIYSCLSQIPEDGSHPEVDTRGLHIKVEEITEHRVEWATVTKLAPEEPAEDDSSETKDDAL